MEYNKAEGEKEMSEFVRTLCVDFDGVIHWYRDGWQGGVIYDAPVPGAIDWLVDMALQDEMEVCIYSSRSKDPEQLSSMKDYLLKYIKEHFDRQDVGVVDNKSLTKSVMDALKFPTEKPAAWITIDDRAICFKGTFPTTQEIKEFKPWNK